MNLIYQLLTKRKDTRVDRARRSMFTSKGLWVTINIPQGASKPFWYCNEALYLTSLGAILT